MKDNFTRKEFSPTFFFTLFLMQAEKLAINFLLSFHSKR